MHPRRTVVPTRADRQGERAIGRKELRTVMSATILREIGVILERRFACVIPPPRVRMLRTRALRVRCHGSGSLGVEANIARVRIVDGRGVVARPKRVELSMKRYAQPHPNDKRA